MITLVLCNRIITQCKYEKQLNKLEKVSRDGRAKEYTKVVGITAESLPLIFNRDSIKMCRDALSSLHSCLYIFFGSTILIQFILLLFVLVCISFF